MSETDFLKLKKHDNVETNTEKFDIENYLNGNWDKINKNAKEVNTEISNINSNNTELEKELKEAQEDFYQNSIRGQASGEYIHVKDSSNCRARIGIGGNQEQETRSGKNLLELMEGTYSNNGITAVVKNGIVTLNGTATAISFIGINLLKNLDLATGNTYRLSAFNTNTVGEAAENYCSLRIKQDGTKETVLSKVNSNNAIVGGFSFSYITIRTAQGITYNNFVVKPQLELGAGTKEWEQGGASPSSDYPSKIKTVGSNVNYYNKETEEIGFVLTDGSLQPNNTVWTHSDFIEVNSNEIISITCENKANGQFEIVEYDKNKKFLKHNICDYMHTEAKNKYTITTTSTTKYIIGAYRNNLNMNNIMVVKGAEVLPYNPNCNGMGSVKVTKCNKNIYNKNEEIICNGVGIGANGELFSRSDQKLLIIPISKLETNIAISLTKTFSYSLRYAFSDKIVENIDCKIFDTGYVENSTTTNIKVNKTVQNNKHNYLLLSFTKKDSYSDLQVEYKKEVSQYEEHQEQSYIMPVQKEMLEGDYVADVEHHEWKKLTLTGNENIKLNTAFANVFNIEIPKINIMNQQVCLCNIAKGVVYNTALLTIQDNIIMTASLNKIVYKSTKFSSLSEFKTYLQNQYEEGTPVIVYYKLAEPINLELTDEQKAVAKELSNARTYKNVTNITTDSIAILDLDYAKDLEELTEYSTEERVIGRWIDGKPLYSKVGSIKFTSVYDSSGLHTRGSLIDSDIDYGTVSKVLNKNLLSSSLFNTYGTSTSNVYVENRQGNSNKGYILGFTDRTDLLNTTIYVVVEYTKTTD